MPFSDEPIPIGQVIGMQFIFRTDSISSRSSIGSLPSRSNLFMNVIIGVSLSLHTSINFIVLVSTPFAQSITIIAESTAVKVRYVSSEKSS